MTANEVERVTKAKQGTYKAPGDRGIHIVYLPVCQAWALMWCNHILNIFNDKAEAVEEAAWLTRARA